MPAGNLVGKLNEGWSISKRVLQFERAMVSGMGQAAETGSDKARVDGTRPRSLYALYTANVDASSQMPKSVLSNEIVKAEMDLRGFQLTMRRTVEEAKTGSATGQEVAMLKLVGSELNSKRAELRVRILGTQGLGWGDVGFGEQDLMFTREWLSCKAGTIAGGSSEIQKNIIAKRILGLPE